MGVEEAALIQAGAAVVTMVATVVLAMIARAQIKASLSASREATFAATAQVRPIVFGRPVTAASVLFVDEGARVYYELANVGSGVAVTVYHFVAVNGRSFPGYQDERQKPLLALTRVKISFAND